MGKERDQPLGSGKASLQGWKGGLRGGGGGVMRGRVALQTGEANRRTVGWNVRSELGAEDREAAGPGFTEALLGRIKTFRGLVSP